MNSWLWHRHAIRHSADSIALLCMLFVFGGVLAWCLGGAIFTWIVLGACAVLVLSRPSISSSEALEALHARALSPEKFPRLNALTAEVAHRAGLRRVPTLYWVPYPDANAAVFGAGREAAIVLTSRVIRELEERELQSVIAHELSHLRNNDVWVMGLVHRFIGVTEFLRGLFFFVGLPIIAVGDWRPDLWSCLIVVAAPTIIQSLHLRMARTREYKADLHAARLVRDPRSVACALRKIDDVEDGEVDESEEASNTHPSTRNRVERLEALFLANR